MIKAIQSLGKLETCARRQLNTRCSPGPMNRDANGTTTWVMAHVGIINLFSVFP